MIKTTIYLNESELKNLKAMASKQKGKSISQLIREAIQLLSKTKPEKNKNSYLLKLLKEKPRKSNSFLPDPVTYQRRLRDEWED